MPMAARVLIRALFLVLPLLAVLSTVSPAAAQSRPEETVVNTPTTQSLRAHKSYFRLTHRFARDWRRGSFGNLLEDLFGLDQGAIIGLEYRFAPTGNTQVAAYRSMLFRTIQFAGRFDAWRQSEAAPVSLSIATSIEGSDNFREHYSPAISIVVSRDVGRLALY